MARLTVCSPDQHGYSLQQGVIRLHDRIWVGANSALQTKIITALHSSADGGHSGQLTTYHRLKRMFYWKGMERDVEEFVK